MRRFIPAQGTGEAPDRAPGPRISRARTQAWIGPVRPSMQKAKARIEFIQER